MQAKTLAQIAVERYGQQFPHVYLQAARTSFFLQDVAGAVKYTEAALARKQPDPVEVHLLLNRSVLALFSGDWATAFENCRTMTLHAAFKAIDFKGIVEFADTTRDMGYDAAVYLQVLYRLFVGEKVAPQLKADLEAFVNTDLSKEDLRRFISELERLGLDRFKQQLPTFRSLTATHAAKKGRRRRK